MASALEDWSGPCIYMDCHFYEWPPHNTTFPLQGKCLAGASRAKSTVHGDNPFKAAFSLSLLKAEPPHHYSNPTRLCGSVQVCRVLLELNIMKEERIVEGGNVHPTILYCNLCFYDLAGLCAGDSMVAHRALCSSILQSQPTTCAAIACPAWYTLYIVILP